MNEIKYMPKWKKNETEFSVSISNDGNGSHVCRIPKPIIEKLGNPNRIKFVLSGKKIFIDMG